MIPALSRAGLLGCHRELQVQQDHQERICSISQLTHLLQSWSSFSSLLFIRMNSSPKSLLSDKNTDHPLPTLCWVAAVVGMRFACGQTHSPTITASPNCTLAWIKACREVAFLFRPYNGFCSGCCCCKIPALQSNWTWKCYWASPQTSQF